MSPLSIPSYQHIKSVRCSEEHQQPERVHRADLLRFEGSAYKVLLRDAGMEGRGCGEAGESRTDGWAVLRGDVVHAGQERGDVGGDQQYAD